jgi:hypothetical protein
MDKCNLQNIEHRKLKMSNMNPINKPGLIYDRKKIELVNLASNNSSFWVGDNT